MTYFKTQVILLTRNIFMKVLYARTCFLVSCNLPHKRSQKGMHAIAEGTEQIIESAKWTILKIHFWNIELQNLRENFGKLPC